MDRDAQVSHTLPVIAAAAVERALDFPGLAAALAHAFAAGANVPLRHVHTLQGADRLLLMPAWRPGAALGVKLATVYPGNAARGRPTVGALYLLFDGASGEPRALIDGEALTLRRTAAVSALAARYLARTDARRLLVIGTGKLAPYMARAHFECAREAGRPIERVAVWGRRTAEAARMAADLQGFGLPATAIDDLARALGAADIVTCATTATAPIVHGIDVRPGTHIDLVGAFTPQMREADDALIARAELYVDTRAGALAEAGDLRDPIASGVIQAAAVRAELAELIREPARGRTDRQAITVFKSVGTALADLAAAERVLAQVIRPAAD